MNQVAQHHPFGVLALLSVFSLVFGWFGGMTVGQGKPDVESMANLHARCDALIVLGRSVHAVPMLQDVIAWRENNLGFGHESTIRARLSLASAWRYMRRWDAAVPHLQRTVALVRGRGDISMQLKGTVHARLGEGLAAFGQRSEAVSELEQARMLLRDSGESAELAEAVDRLIESLRPEPDSSESQE